MFLNGSKLFTSHVKVKKSGVEDLRLLKGRQVLMEYMEFKGLKIVKKLKDQPLQSNQKNLETKEFTNAIFCYFFTHSTFRNLTKKTFICVFIDS